MQAYTFFLTTLLLVVLSCKNAWCQYYSLGSDPGRTRWSVIKTENFKLIYPTETDSLARVYLSYLEGRRDAVNKPLDINPKRIPVILHPYTTQSNGVVTWAPKRIDLLTSPDPYDTGTDPWISHLVTHELRHVGQVEHYTKGIYNVFYYLFGEQITGLGLGLFVSGFSLEGDAVIAETELSSGGRGRNADFTKYYRVMYLNDVFRNYEQLLFGSNKHYTPSKYVFGYLLGSSMRYTSGKYDVNKDLFSGPVKYWYNIVDLIDPTKRTTGLSLDKHLTNSQAILSEAWRQDYNSRGKFTTPDAEELAAKEERLYTEITNPILINHPKSPFNGSVIALKEGMSTAKKMVWIDSTGKEHFIRFFNSTASRPVYHAPSGKIYWTETVTSRATDLEDFSVVMAMDIETEVVKTLTRRSKYFHPAPSSTGDTLAVAEYPITGSSYLTFLQAKDGKPLFRVEAPGKGQIKESVFDGKDVYSTIIIDKGLGLYRYSEGEWEEIVPQQSQGINNLRLHSGKLYFSSDLDGVVNIYEYDPKAYSLVRITNSEYGADFPYFDEKTGDLYYSEYGLKGYRLVVSRPEKLESTPASFSEPYKYPLAEIITEQVEESGVTALINDTINTFDKERFPSKKYSKLLHAFRIHSWFPLHVDIDKIMTFNFENITHAASLGATVLSQNSLGNVVTTLSYGYVKDNYSGRWFHSGHAVVDAKVLANFSVEARFDVNNRNTWTTLYDYRYGTQAMVENQGRPLISTRVLLYYPLQFNSRGWYRSLTPQISWNFDNDIYFSYRGQAPEGSTEALLGEGEMKHELRYGISYGQVIPTATSQIYPRWGFGLTAYGASAPWSDINFGHVMYLNGYVYLPGITRQQGIKVTATWQRQFSDGKLYYMSSFASMPRGYTTFYPTENYLKATIDYAIPIYLGDFRLGPVLYFKRLQLIPFADYAIDSNPRTNTNYYSFGSDLLVDFHIIRLGFPISLGIRYAYTGPQNGQNRNNVSFLFNIAFQ